jgi:orotidine-5'-phosphate decarboxylase
MPFGDRLAAAVAARESQIVLGVDPEPTRLWPQAVERSSEARAALAHAFAEAERAAWSVTAQLVASHAADAADPGESAPDATTPNGSASAAPRPGAPSGSGSAADAERVVGPGVSSAGAFAAGRLEAAAAVLAHSLALVDAAGPACVAVKPQLAFFEQLGFAGWLALEAVCAHARARGLLVLADGKRGDVPSTALAYAHALTGATPTPFGAAAGLRADAFTANPLMGRDALAPLVDGARAAGAGAFLLVRTSNPGATDVLDLQLAAGEPLWERLAALVADLGTVGSEGIADVGAVTGATAPEHLERMRELMPAAPFLLPGVGAQGGDVRTLAPAFAPGRAAGLVTASRSIANAHEEHSGAPAAVARAEAERLREAAWALA